MEFDSISTYLAALEVGPDIDPSKRSSLRPAPHQPEGPPGLVSDQTRCKQAHLLSQIEVAATLLRGLIALDLEDQGCRLRREAVLAQLKLKVTVAAILAFCNPRSGPKVVVAPAAR
jgi:hypothetical protein